MLLVGSAHVTLGLGHELSKMADVVEILLAMFAAPLFAALVFTKEHAAMDWPLLLGANW